MNIPRSEYPRPEFVRKDWVCLNGFWSYAIDNNESGEEKEWMNKEGFDGKILVPFCPESKMSQVEYKDFIECIWYQRSLEIPGRWEGKKILLNFEGVDYESHIYIDGKKVDFHVGGSCPFTVDITSFVTPGRSHNLVLQAKDHLREGIQAMGKQCAGFKSGGCSYTRTTGIWQSVWMEAVDGYALQSCRIIPDFDNSSFGFRPVFYTEKKGLTFSIVISEDGKEVARGSWKASSSAFFTLKLEAPRAWSPEDPFLYDIAFTLQDEAGKELDKVTSYAGLRKIHLEDGKFFLNNEPIFLRFVLDQGYYPESILTAPSDGALKNDILLSMKAGFNGARLHQKIFDRRFHYHADRLGYLSWGEFPDWGMSFWPHFRRTNPEWGVSFRNYMAEWRSVVERDLNHPSIIAWTPFNETNCPHDEQEHIRFLSDVYDLTKSLDPTRPVNDSSGYIHAKTDLWTIHTYAQKTDSLKECVSTEPVYMLRPHLEARAWKAQPYIVDEYGGVRFLPEGRKPFAENSWGYNKEPLTKEEVEQRITELTFYLVDDSPAVGYCYTQLTDIEQEENGIYCYDRTEKFNMEVMNKCFSHKPLWSRY